MSGRQKALLTLCAVAAVPWAIDWLIRATTSTPWRPPAVPGIRIAHR